jgi:hypothetical protein
VLRLNGARRRVAKLMNVTAKVTRRDSQYSVGELDIATGIVDVAAPTTVYEGPMFVTPTGLQARTEDVSGNPASQKTHQGSIPWADDGPEFRPGDEVEILTVDDSETADPQLVGMKFEIIDVVKSSVQVWRAFNMRGLETTHGA